MKAIKGKRLIAFTLAAAVTLSIAAMPVLAAAPSAWQSIAAEEENSAVTIRLKATGNLVYGSDCKLEIETNPQDTQYLGIVLGTGGEAMHAACYHPNSARRRCRDALIAFHGADPSLPTGRMPFSGAARKGISCTPPDGSHHSPSSLRSGLPQALSFVIAFAYAEIIAWRKGIVKGGRKEICEGKLASRSPLTPSQLHDIDHAGIAFTPERGEAFEGCEGFSLVFR